MIRVGFISSISKEWMGGLNYFKNLLFAIEQLKEQDIKIVIFFGKKTDASIKNMFQGYAKVVEDNILDRKSIKWFLQKVESRFFKSNLLLESILKKHKIDILSHSYVTHLKSIKTINWIPDFQHMHLPEMFSSEELRQREKHYLDLIINSDKIILSSYDALKDSKVFAPEHASRMCVLQFVSQPDKKYFHLGEVDKNCLVEKYNIKKEFFYIPNQFWKHKNHMLVFETIKLIVDAHIDICIICTGYLNDHNNKNHIDEIKKFIKVNKLEDNIVLLGLVDYEDVFSLIKFSKAVINPSLFEGWSSTVEECKSVDKNMILSNLPVHKEQYPSATFFDRNDIQSLKEILINYKNPNNSIKQDDLNIRTEKFANTYINIVREIERG